MANAEQYGCCMWEAMLKNKLDSTTSQGRPSDKLGVSMSIYHLFILTAFHEGSWTAARVLFVLFAVERGADAFVIGALAATFSVCPLLLAVQLGKVVDRVGARVPMLCGAAIGALGVLVPYVWTTLPAIFVAIGMIGLFDTIFVVSLQSLVGLLSTPENRARNYSNYTLVMSTAGLLGPLLAGFLIDHFGHATTCLYVSVLILGAIIFVALLRNTLSGAQHGVERAKSGAMAMLRQAGVRRVLVTSSSMAAASTVYQFYLPAHAHAAGLSASSIGIVLAFNAAAAFAARGLLPHLLKRFTEDRVLASTLVFGALGLTLVPFFTSAAALSVVSLIFGIGTGAAGPLIMIMMYASSAAGRPAEALGLKMTVNHLTKMAGPVVFGAMGSALGLLPMFCFTGFVLAIVGWVVRQRDKPSKSAKSDSL